MESREKEIIAWEEIFNSYNLKDLPKQIVIDVWKDEDTLLDVCSIGHFAIMR